MFCLAGAAHAQTGAQAGTQTSGQASVEANKQGAQASGSASNSSAASAQAGGNSDALANGTSLNAALNAPIDSKKAKAGDPVVAHTTEAAKSEGKAVIPKGAKLVGHVTRASARSKGDSDSELGLHFDKAVLKDGQEIPLNVAVRAVAAAQGATSAGEAGPGLDAMGNTGAAAAGGSPIGGGGRGVAGGLAGGVASTAGATAGGLTNTAAGVGQTAGGTVNAAGGVAGSANEAVGGLNGAGQLASNSRGVFGLNGLNLVTDASSATQGSVITSAGKNVHLDSGTKLLLVTEAAASATPK
jgi:hypothetical protein